MAQLQTFLAMGGYGAFVWPAFALTALIMVWLLVTTLRRLRARERALAALQMAPPGQRRGGGPGAAVERAGAEGTAP